MRAKTKCPNCKEWVDTDCEGCIRGETLMHDCGKDGETEVFDVKWKIIEE